MSKALARAAAPPAMQPTDPAALIGSEFLWMTGMRARLVALAENVAISGNFYDRAVLIFESSSGGLITYPAQRFVDELRPWHEREIVGSGHPSRIYGPAVQ